MEANLKAKPQPQANKHMAKPTNQAHITIEYMANLNLRLLLNHIHLQLHLIDPISVIEVDTKALRDTKAHKDIRVNDTRDPNMELKDQLIIRI